MVRSLKSIEITTTEFEFSHGMKPSGRGNWAFEFRTDGAWSEPWWAPGGTRTYADALAPRRTR
jgi:hypothetical protein